MRPIRFILTTSVAVLMTGCMVGPNFKSPQVKLPSAYIYQDSLSAAEYAAQVVDARWWQSFGDRTLDSLVEVAIKGNRNLAVTLSNIEQARLKAQSARAELLPTLSLAANASASYTYMGKVNQQYSLMPQVQWDLDLFGKIRRMAEAANANYLATEYGYRAALISLVSEVATTYFSLLQYDRSLEIAEATYASRRESMSMMDSMFCYGMSSAVDLEQARASTATAKAAVEQYQRAVRQTALAMNLLLGENPQKVLRGKLYDQVADIEIPVGLPSSLLERRPDVMQAYYTVAAANASIGVAVANRLPSISLTGEGGLLASFVRDVSSGKPLAWSATAGLVQPLLNWGNNKRAVKIAQEQTKVATLEYEQSVLSAINEVEQALVAIDTYKRQLNSLHEIVLSSSHAQFLTGELYKSGVASYLDVLDADRTLFNAQTSYTQAVQSYLASYVSLYKALGGGW